MSNLFDILRFRQEKSVQEKSEHTQARDSNAIIDDRATKASSLEVSEPLGTQDRRKRRSASSENAEVIIEDDPSQGEQGDHHAGEDKIFELDSLKQFTIPKKKKAKKGNYMLKCDLLSTLTVLQAFNRKPLRWHAPFNCRKWVCCCKIRKKGWEDIFFKVVFKYLS